MRPSSVRDSSPAPLTQRWKAAPRVGSEPHEGLWGPASAESIGRGGTPEEGELTELSTLSTLGSSSLSKVTLRAAITTTIIREEGAESLLPGIHGDVDLAVLAHVLNRYNAQRWLKHLRRVGADPVSYWREQLGEEIETATRGKNSALRGRIFPGASPEASLQEQHMMSSTFILIHYHRSLVWLENRFDEMAVLHASRPCVGILNALFSLVFTCPWLRNAILCAWNACGINGRGSRNTSRVC